MIKVLLPEYHHATVGADYVSVSTQKAYSLQMEWERYHWFVLLVGELLKRVYMLGRKDHEWLKDITSLLVLAVMNPNTEHPIDSVYREFELVIEEVKNRNKPKFQIA